jgi:hypothetical protein
VMKWCSRPDRSPAGWGPLRQRASGGVYVCGGFPNLAK